MSDRDPRLDPRVGDIVQAVATQPAIHVTFTQLTVQAVVGNLIAVSSDEHGREIAWKRREDWCQPGVWIKEWEVIHAAE